MDETPRKLYKILHSKCMESNKWGIKNLRNEHFGEVKYIFYTFSEFEMETSFVERDGLLFYVTDGNVPLVAGMPIYQLIDMGE